jgi:hypothetical protein
VEIEVGAEVEGERAVQRVGVERVGRERGRALRAQAVEIHARTRRRAVARVVLVNERRGDERH